MSEIETIEGQVVEEMADLPAVREAHAVNLFGDASPASVVERATEAANALAAVIERKELYSVIGKGKHVHVEGWTLLGSMLGVFPIIEWTRQIEDGWEARCVVQTRNGDTIGAAEAMCTRIERSWKTRDEYALRSMAQTRAVSKALRHPLGFIMTLAGYEATPESEMPGDAEPGESSREPAAPAQTGSGLTGSIRGKPAARDVGTWAGVKALVQGYGATTWDDWLAFGEQAKRYTFGDVDKLAKEQKAAMLRLTCVAANKLAELRDPAEFPPPERAVLQEAWLAAIPEAALEGPPWRMSPDETDRQTKDDIDAAKEESK